MKRILIYEDDLSRAGSKYIAGYLFYAQGEIESEEVAREAAVERARKLFNGDLDLVNDYHDFGIEYLENHAIQELDIKNKRVRYYDPETYKTRKSDDIKFDYSFGYQDLPELQKLYDETFCY